MFDKVIAVHDMYVEVPNVGDAKEALQIVQSLAGKSEQSLTRMYTKGVPPGMQVNKIFGHTVTENY